MNKKSLETDIPWERVTPWYNIKNITLHEKHTLLHFKDLGYEKAEAVMKVISMNETDLINISLTYTWWWSRWSY